MALFNKKKNVFYSLLKEQMDKVNVAGEAFYDLVYNYENVEEKIVNIKTIETECDMQSHKVMKQLNNSRSTPFDREDIFTCGCTQVVKRLPC